MYTDAFQQNTTFMKKVKHEQLKLTDVFNDYLIACSAKLKGGFF